MKCEFCDTGSGGIEYVEKVQRRACICRECREKFKQEVIEEKLKSVQKPDDFKGWKDADLSEAFWIHLVRYQKQPNQRSLSILSRAFLWAVHDNHGLSNSFRHALKWCGINLNFELRRTDLLATDDAEVLENASAESGLLEEI